MTRHKDYPAFLKANPPISPRTEVSDDENGAWVCVLLCRSRDYVGGDETLVLLWMGDLCFARLCSHVFVLILALAHLLLPYVLHLDILSPSPHPSQSAPAPVTLLAGGAATLPVHFRLPATMKSMDTGILATSPSHSRPGSTTAASSNTTGGASRSRAAGRTSSSSKRGRGAKTVGHARARARAPAHAHGRALLSHRPRRVRPATAPNYMCTGVGFSPVVGRGCRLGEDTLQPYDVPSDDDEDDASGGGSGSGSGGGGAHRTGGSMSRPRPRTSASSSSRGTPNTLLMKSLCEPLQAAWKSSTDLQERMRSGDHPDVLHASRSQLASASSSALGRTDDSTLRPQSPVMGASRRRPGLFGHVLVRGDEKRGRRKAEMQQVQTTFAFALKQQAHERARQAADAQARAKQLLRTESGGQFGTVASMGGVVKQAVRTSPHRWIQRTKSKIARRTFQAAARRVARAARIKVMGGGIAKMGRSLGKMGGGANSMFALTSKLMLAKTRVEVEVEKELMAGTVGASSSSAGDAKKKKMPLAGEQGGAQASAQGGGHRAGANTKVNAGAASSVVDAVTRMPSMAAPSPHATRGGSSGKNVEVAPSGELLVDTTTGTMPEFRASEKHSTTPASRTMRRRSLKRASTSLAMRRRPTISHFLHSPAESTFINEPWSPMLSRFRSTQRAPIVNDPDVLDPKHALSKKHPERWKDGYSRDRKGYSGAKDVPRTKKNVHRKLSVGSLTQVTAWVTRVKRKVRAVRQVVAYLPCVCVSFDLSLARVVVPRRLN